MLYSLLLALTFITSPTYSQEVTPEAPIPPKTEDPCKLKNSKPLKVAPKFDGYTLQVWRIRYNQDETFERVSDKPLHAQSFSKAEISEAKSEDVLTWEDEKNPGNLALFRFDRDLQKPKLIRFGNWEVLNIKSDSLLEPSFGSFQAEPTETERQQEFPAVRLVVPADPKFSLESFEFVITPRPCNCDKLIESTSTLETILRKETAKERLLRRIVNGLEKKATLGKGNGLDELLEKLEQFRQDQKYLRLKKSSNRKFEKSPKEELDEFFKDALDLKENLELWIKTFDDPRNAHIKNLDLFEKLQREAAEKHLKEYIREIFSPDEASDLERALDRALRTLKTE